MTTISAEPILLSQHANTSHRVDTLIATYPRWIHAEQRTHRIISLDEHLQFLEPTPSLMADPNLSRNAASSRAIPVAKMIADIEADPAVPLFWGKNIGGMQATEELPKHLIVIARDNWLYAMDNAIKVAKMMAHLADDEETGKPIGAHKQIINRLLEPFMHIRVLVSATEWGNFLALRDHADAEPHIQILARCIRDVLTLKPHQVLKPGEWHMPYITAADRAEVRDRNPENALDALRKISTARCASLSYMTVDSKPMPLFRAIELHDKLVGSTPIHASPTEHVAQADEFSSLPGGGWRNNHEHRNFRGFRQYRAMIGG